MKSTPPTNIKWNYKYTEGSYDNKQPLYKQLNPPRKNDQTDLSDKMIRPPAVAASLTNSAPHLTGPAANLLAGRPAFLAKQPPPDNPFSMNKYPPTGKSNSNEQSDMQKKEIGDTKSSPTKDGSEMKTIDGLKPNMLQTDLPAQNKQNDEKDLTVHKTSLINHPPPSGFSKERPPFFPSVDGRPPGNDALAGPPIRYNRPPPMRPDMRPRIMPPRPNIRPPPPRPPMNDASFRREPPSLDNKNSPFDSKPRFDGSKALGEGSAQDSDMRQQFGMRGPGPQQGGMSKPEFPPRPGFRPRTRPMLHGRGPRPPPGANPRQRFNPPFNPRMRPPGPMDSQNHFPNPSEKPPPLPDHYRNSDQSSEKSDKPNHNEQANFKNQRNGNNESNFKEDFRNKPPMGKPPGFHHGPPRPPHSSQFYNQCEKPPPPINESPQKNQNDHDHPPTSGPHIKSDNENSFAQDDNKPMFDKPPVRPFQNRPPMNFPPRPPPGPRLPHPNMMRGQRGGPRPQHMRSRPGFRPRW